MSKEVREALQPSVGGTTVDFVDASISIVQKELAADIAGLRDNLATAVARLEKLESDIAALSVDRQVAYDDDKYALTKQKLVRLMIDMGYMR